MDCEVRIANGHIWQMGHITNLPMQTDSHHSILGGYTLGVPALLLLLLSLSLGSAPFLASFRVRSLFGAFMAGGALGVAHDSGFFASKVGSGFGSRGSVR